ncbi:hypothetical protein [Actinacidiphila acidipaludis]|uniref:Uncharacterized protein n=1 Tax=Actinacidiphila acidipaludis TaxID=2873382 RepID=A0ABS7Q2Y6_9ACTN|nr:hypothetical protein [Streptomyces acidipaludis]MBY8876810.1 hypothetical protein [Streptomyces acidipaludis]
MNELELAQFAAPAAQTLLATMLTDGWNAAKGRLIHIFSRTEGDPQTAGQSLDELRQRAIANNSPEALEQRRSEVFALLCTAISRDPGAIAPLKELLRDLEDSSAPVKAREIHQSATVQDNGVNFQQISGIQNYRKS